MGKSGITELAATHRHAQDSLQIEALKKKQDELVGKRKKIAVDCNQAFANPSGYG
jgi:hypothetical protein